MQHDRFPTSAPSTAPSNSYSNSQTLSPTTTPTSAPSDALGSPTSASITSSPSLLQSLSPSPLPSAKPTVSPATDNPTRTVANVRMHFTKGQGSLGTTGSVAFGFTHMAEFKIKNEAVNVDELELELIDFGLEEIGEDTEGHVILRTPFNEYGNMSKALEDKKIEVVSAELTWVPGNLMELDEEQSNEVLKLVDHLEQDDDVQKVYHNLK